MTEISREEMERDYPREYAWVCWNAKMGLLCFAGLFGAGLMALLMMVIPYL